MNYNRHPITQHLHQKTALKAVFLFILRFVKVTYFEMDARRMSKNMRRCTRCTLTHIFAHPTKQTLKISHF